MKENNGCSCCNEKKDFDIDSVLKYKGNLYRLCGSLEGEDYFLYKREGNMLKTVLRLGCDKGTALALGVNAKGKMVIFDTSGSEAPEHSMEIPFIA